MIRLNNNLVVNVDTNNYTLQEDTHTVNKDNNPIYKPISYHDNLEKAITQAVRYSVRKELQGNEKSLTEAIETIKQVNEEFNKILKNAIEGNEN